MSVEKIGQFKLPMIATGATAEERAAAKKWEYLSDPSIIIMKAYQGYALIGSILGNKVFGGGAVKQKSVEQLIHNAQENFIFGEGIGVDGNRITLEVLLPTLFCFANGADPTPTGDSAQKFELGRKLLKTLFPKMDLDKLPISKGKVITSIAPNIIPIEALGAISNIPDVPPLDMSNWDEKYKGMISLKLQPYDVEAKTSSIATNISPHADISMSVSVSIRIKLPLEYCHWSTNSDETNFSPVILHTQFHRRWGFYSTDEPYGKLKDICYNPANIQKIENEAIKQYTLTSKPQVNSEGICSMNDGRLLWIPAETSINVSGIYNECIEPPNEATPTDLRKINLTPLQNRLVGVSWLTNKMIITDVESKFKIVDLTGARAPSREALTHLMKQPIGSSRFKAMLRLAQRLYIEIDVSGLEDSFEEFTYDDLIEDEVNKEEKVSPFQKQIYDIGKKFKQAYQSLIASSLPVVEQYELRPYFALFGVYAEGRKQYAANNSKNLALNRAVVQADVAPPLHDLKGLAGLMPHQIRVDNELATQPEGALLAVAAGGGKTPSLIFDVCNLMFNKKIQRPVLVMPRNLLPQFAREIVKFTNGQMRPYIISNRVWKDMLIRQWVVFKDKSQWIKKPEGNKYAYDTGKFDNLVDEKSLIALLHKQPRNTIFLVDYNWLSQEAIDIEIDEESQPFYPHAAILDRVGFDYVGADESHKAKNAQSNRTAAVSVLFANAKYRRCSSGTILSNTSKDYTGQMGLIEPLALGSVGNFLKDGGSLKGRDIRTIAHENMATFARRIQVPRREWIHMLPQLREHVWTVRMTKKQQEFNNMVMEEKLAELENDKKIQALKKVDPKLAEEKLAKNLKSSFTPLEIWLNAPDSQMSDYGKAFSIKEGVTAEDLISPKIEAIDELIKRHIDGGVMDTDEGSEQIAPDPNKIIVVGYNIEVSKHIFRHSKYAHLGVHYAAGDDAAMAKFEDDREGTPKILYADMGSILEGKNLQLASRIIVTQVVYVPGAMEQLYARIWRPDTPDKDGNIKYIRPYVWIDTVICLAGNTLIATKERGIVRIDELTNNDKGIEELKVTIASRLGVDKTCLWMNKGIKDTFNVNTDDGYSVCGTDNHEILRVDPSTLEQSWTQIKDLRPGDILCVSKEKVVRTTKLKLDISHIKATRWGTKPIKLPKFMDQELAWCLGFFNAEGCFGVFKSGNVINMRVSNNDINMVDRWCETMHKIFNVGFKIKTRKGNLKNKDHYIGEINSVLVCRVFESLGMSVRYHQKDGKRASHHKNIPWSIMQADEQSQLAYIAGYVDGDGCIHRDGINISSRSEELIKPLQVMLLSHGIFSRLFKAKLGNHIQHTLKLASKDDTIVFCEKIEPYLTKVILNYAKNIKRSSKIQGVKHNLLQMFKNRFVERIGNYNNVTKINNMQTVYSNDVNELVVMDKGEGAIISRNLKDNKYLHIPSSKNNDDFMVGLEKISSDIATNLKSLPDNFHYVNITSIDYAGKQAVYDLSMRIGADPSFAANGIIVHNCMPSIEVPKSARLISKQVENLLAEEEDFSPTLKNIVTSHPTVFEKLKQPKMSLKLIRKYAMEYSVEGTPDILQDQFNAYKLVKQWEGKEFKIFNDRRVAEITARTGKKPSAKDLAKLSMIPVKSDETPEFKPQPGLQTQGFYPWARGFTGLNNSSLKLLPLSIPTEEDESEEDEDDEKDDKKEIKVEDTVPVEAGDPVVTQFGIGIVTKTRANSTKIKVLVRGFSETPLSLDRTTTLGAADEVNRAALLELLNQAGRNGLPTLRLDKNGSASITNISLPENNIAITLNKMMKLGRQNKLPKKLSPKELLQLQNSVKPAIPAGPRHVDEDGLPVRPIVAPNEPKGISKAPGVDEEDPFITKPQKPLPPPINKPAPAPTGIVPRRLGGLKPAPIDMRTIKDEDLWEEREGEAIIFNGEVCILTTDGDASDPTLLKNGFDRIGGSVVIQVANPKVYRAVVDLLAKNFLIPRLNKKYLDQFADIYSAQKQNIAYLKAKELPFHQLWLKDQRKKASDPKEIRPWPVVEVSTHANSKDGFKRGVFLYINREVCPAANKLKNLDMPPGVLSKKPLKPALIAMVNSTRAAKVLLQELKEKHIRFTDEREILTQLAKMR